MVKKYITFRGGYRFEMRGVKERRCVKKKGEIKSAELKA
jgi:hypothetical protein